MEEYIFLFNIALISVFQVFMMISYILRKKKEKFWGSLILYTVVLAFLIYEHYSLLKIPGLILTCFVITVLGHSFVGKYLEVYYTSDVYDRYLHLFGAFSFSLTAYAILEHLIKPGTESIIYKSVFVMTIGITLGVFFEIAEFVHDRYFPKKIRSQHGLEDTDFDLIFNIAGSFIAGALSGIILK
jgi:hypothetical protein